MSVARAIATKDLRIEWRSKVLVNQVLPFAGIVMVLFAFALDNDGILQRVAPGLVWLAVLFSSLIIVQRTFAIESADNALDAIKVAGVSPAGVFLGKSVALVVQLLLFECVLVLLSLVLYQVHLSWGGAVLLVTVSFLANIGIAAMGALYGGLGAAAKVAKPSYRCCYCPPWLLFSLRLPEPQSRHLGSVAPHSAKDGHGRHCSLYLAHSLVLVEHLPLECSPKSERWSKATNFR